MGVAVGEDEAADAIGVGGDQDLRDGAAGVVADDGDVVEPRAARSARRAIAAMPGGGEVGAGQHRDPVGADRPVGRDAAAAVGEAVDDAVPEAAVDQVAVDEDDRLAARPPRGSGSVPAGRSISLRWSVSVLIASS